MNKPDFLDACFTAGVCPQNALNNKVVEVFLKDDKGARSNVVSQITLSTILNEQFK